MYEIEKLFKEEVTEKKRVARGAHNMKGHGVKGGIKGGMKTPVDFLRGKDKKIYMGNGDVIVSNIYDNIENVPSVKDLEGMEVEAAKKIIETVRLKFTVKPLLSHWGMSQYQFYNQFLVKYGLAKPFPSSSQGKKENGEKKTRSYNRKGSSKKVSDEAAVTSTPAAPAADQQLSMFNMLNEEIKSIKEILSQSMSNKSEQKVENNGFQLRFNGELTGEDISNKIVNYISALDSSTKYKIKFSIEEN